jgi:hypothetical protein
MPAQGHLQTCPAQDGTSASPLKADIRASVHHVGYGPILLQKSVASDGCPSAVRLRAPGFDLPASTLYATLTLRDALNRIWRWPGDQRCEPPKVLGDGSKEQTRHGRLVVHAVEADRASGTNTGLDGAFRAAPGCRTGFLFRGVSPGGKLACA